MQPEIIGKGSFSYRIDYTDKLETGLLGEFYGCYRISDTPSKKYSVKIVKFELEDITESMRELELSVNISGWFIC